MKEVIRGGGVGGGAEGVAEEWVPSLTLGNKVDLH